MTDIQVRKANAADASALLALKQEASAVLLIRLGHTLEQVGTWQAKFCTEPYILKHLKAPHALYVVHDGDEVSGMASLTLKDDGDDVYCYFANLYTRRSDTGAGSRLMVHRLGVTENFGVDFISCHVHSENHKAQRFVQHYGMVEYGRYTEPTLGSTTIQYRKYV